MSSPKRKVLLVGWDAADWKVARPLMERGELPNLARLVAEGASGNIATIYPALSPMLWTSISTGKRPAKHGIHGFSEPLPDGSGVRPITTLGRKTKAIWNILNQSDLRPSVVGWWPSHPAEPIRGVMVSNHFHQAGDDEKPRRLLPGSVHPADWFNRLAELRIVPTELPGEMIRLFIPEYHKVDQTKDKRVHSLAHVLAETVSMHAAATEVVEHAEWDFAAVYYDAIDHFCHGFMKYNPPRQKWVSEEDFAIYQHVVANAYRYHDAMLGRLLQLAGPGVTVIVMSDHGFHPDALRPGYIPAEAAGPAVEHRHFGIFCMSGPGVKRGETIFGASVLDVAPTLCHLFGLPVGLDMDGKVLVTAFEEPGEIQTVPSWDDVPGEAGTHPPGAQLDPVAAAEAMKQLVALGYVAPPGDNMKKVVDETVAELKYNLARAHDDTGRPDLSAPLYEALHAADPEDQRYPEKLIGALISMGDRVKARAVLDAFDAHCATAAPVATAELKRRIEEKPNDKLNPALEPKDAREMFERRVIAERTSGFVLSRGLLRLRLNLADKRTNEAREGLAELETLHEKTGAPGAMMFAVFYAQLRDDKKALFWLDKALERDPEDWQALALAARLHMRGRRFGKAVDAAAESLSLIYFQPFIHFVLGRGLRALGDFAGAERALRVAVAQQPGLILAHQELAKLYDQDLGQPAEAAHHRLTVVEMRARVKERRRTARTKTTSKPVATAVQVEMPTRPGRQPADPANEIVVVAGLPRSGTSMLMQLLAAGGVPPLTDGARVADEDNPRGYFELEAATRLGQDRSWLPQARGKAVKLALPLVMQLPPGESYRILVIEREPSEVLKSQHAMLDRLGRTGAALGDEALAAEFQKQRERVRTWLERRTDVAVLPLRYDAILADAGSAAEKIAAFLGRPFDKVAAAAAVDPSLRRQS